MKVAVAVILAVLISSCEGQKGGAKSAMRNRGRGGSGRGRSSMGRNNYGGSGSRGQDDIFGNVDLIHPEMSKIEKYKIQVMEPGERPVSDCASSGEISISFLTTLNFVGPSVGQLGSDNFFFIFSSFLNLFHFFKLKNKCI